MEKVEKELNVVIYNSILNGLCKEMSVDVARWMIDSLKSLVLPDAITYNTLINGNCGCGNIDEAFALFLEMRKVGRLVNRVTYNTLINFLCKFGCIQQAKELMKRWFYRAWFLVL